MTEADGGSIAPPSALVVTGAPPPVSKRPTNRRRAWLPIVLFLAPAAVVLGAIVIYPTLATIGRSFYDQSGTNFVGGGNYRELFSTTALLVALRNNAIWVIVFPFVVTFFGLVFAVLTERIRWSTAFKTVVFMPMAISLFASGVIWRMVYQTDPHRGVINAGIGAVADLVHPPGLYPSANAASGLTAERNTVSSKALVGRSGTVELGFNHILDTDIPPGALQAHSPRRDQNGVAGVVWRDFKPGGGGTIGVIDPGEVGMPGMHLSLIKPDGSRVAETTSGMDGSFDFANVAQGEYRVVVDDTNFRTAFQGLDWLGPQSLTPTSALSDVGQSLLSIPTVVLAEIVAMLWIWSGFAMVVIAAGLAAMNREVLEAARMDGATEWQTFRRITLPLLRPVLVVVFITMVINVLKIFDIVLAISPDASQQASNVIALQMWQVGFTGGGNYGLSSATAVLLFVLVIPVMLLNVRRIRG